MHAILCVYIYIHMYAYVFFIYKYIYLYIYTYIGICICICVCEITCILFGADDLSIIYIDIWTAGDMGHLLLLPWVAGGHCVGPDGALRLCIASVISGGLWGIYQPRKGV